MSRVSLAAERPAVVLVARPIAVESAADRLWLRESSEEQIPAGALPVTTLDRDDLYVSPSARQTLETRDQFNVIHPAGGWKVDLVIRKERAFSRQELARRTHARLLDVDTYAATAEDTILSKLEWAAAGGSDRQINDAAAVLDVSRSTVDERYLDRWAEELGITDLLARARALTERGR